MHRLLLPSNSGVGAATHPDAEVRAELITRLAGASGHSGMIGGQIIDMLADASFGVEDVINLQRRKTGQLFEFSCEAGPILGEASGEDRRRLKAYATVKRWVSFSRSLMTFSM